MTDEEISRALKLGKRESVAVRDMLRSLCNEGELLCDSHSRFGTSEQFGALRGRFSGNERGFGFFLPDDGSGDLFIPPRATEGALHGDLVLACPVSGRSDDEGEILAILERGTKELVGTYVREGRAGHLVPDDRRFQAEVYIPSGKSNGAKQGQKAVARIKSFEGRTPVGEISEVLGQAGELFVEETSILRAHSLREEFPPAVLSEGQRQAGRPITEKDLIGREDLRGELVITVDGEDTRDIDDAISLTKRGGKYFLGVHIADVSHYVGRGSALDEEAFLRGTSVYFPDRVLPMLPPSLSNGICSLNEGEDRLTLSCLMTVDERGKVTSRRVCPSVIRSRRRMTYTEVTAIAEGDGKTCAKYPELAELVKTAVGLTKLLKKVRRELGSVALDVREAKILYEDGKISIPEAPRTISHEMIEQFMVLANETVAELMTERHAPFLYRIHEQPSAEKAEAFAAFLKESGIEAGFDPARVTPRDYANVLSRLEGSPLYSLVNRVMLRSMMKARYSPENTGHFGLASQCYCHFTSPIRRYPDLCIHRIIKEALVRPAGVERFASFVQEAAVRSSETERNAADAERDVDALYIATYMQEHIGEEYDGVISGVTSYGLYAELPNTVEGFVPVESLPDDRYEYFETQHSLRGFAHQYTLGERIRVRVAGVDQGARRTIFEIL